MADLDPNLIDYAITDRQTEILEAVQTHDGVRAAARALGCHHKTIEAAVARIQKRAARHGYAPGHWDSGVAPSYCMGKVTVQRGSSGNVERVWERQHPERDGVLQEVYQSLAADLPREKPVAPPKATNAALANCYVLTDYHLGMLAWHEETGEDWDTKIAEDALYSWFASAIDAAPDAETAILAQIGDYLHWDGLEAVTPANKHVLDADTRFQKVARVAIKSLRRIVRMMLEKHQHVHLIMAEGNHDPASSVWLREFLPVLFEDEPRITVDQSAAPFYCYEHGSTSLFFHHGHKVKPKEIDQVFAAQFREVFGRTRHSYAHLGHLHHIDMKETRLMVVEQHRTLASKDAYASRAGYLAGRSASCITYHKDYGEVGRVTITPDMLRST